MQYSTRLDPISPRGSLAKRQRCRCDITAHSYNLIIAGIGSVKFPRCISESARKLIEGLCNEHPAER